VRRHATAGRRGVIGSGVQMVQRRTMPHTDMAIVGATTTASGVLPAFPSAFKAEHRQRL